jgi:hypothetical protein
VAAGLLALAVWVARDRSRAPHDRDVATFTILLAVALAASPIVWVHYFLLLVVPIALTRPRMSLLWFVPFAYFPLGESAWPAGDAGKLALALITTTVILVVAAFGRLFEGRVEAVRSRFRESRPVNQRARSDSALQR